ncbi:hypothetical protein HU200_064166 [Digitaria exilis]|uniref:Uncharacterized protein n=1 Tax=Digitaria exilis TaxID=1010633 RepID=A0A835A646_9POAL|nr:hypothetical protein HU200_064166 [Digitaria exilis]
MWVPLRLRGWNVRDVRRLSRPAFPPM